MKATGFNLLIPDKVDVERTVVVDVGFILDRGWAVIEFNTAWGSGLNGCNPDNVLPAIDAASESKDR